MVKIVENKADYERTEEFKVTVKSMIDERDSENDAQTRHKKQFYYYEFFKVNKTTRKRKIT